MSTDLNGGRQRARPLRSCSDRIRNRIRESVRLPYAFPESRPDGISRSQSIDLQFDCPALRDPSSRRVDPSTSMETTQEPCA